MQCDAAIENPQIAKHVKTILTVYFSRRRLLDFCYELILNSAHGPRHQEVHWARLAAVHGGGFHGYRGPKGLELN